MMMKWLRRRAFLEAGAAAASAGLLAGNASGATTDLVSALGQLQPTVAALAQSAIMQLPATTTQLYRLGLSPALMGVLTDIVSAILVGGGLKHGALVRRLRNPAMLKVPLNAHFVPQGRAFSAFELRTYAPQPASGGGV